MIDLAALFRKKDAINLLPKDSFERSFLGRVLGWALSFGKWTVIVTQLVVVGAFLFRFGLDRKLTNLRKSIDEELATIRSYESIEDEYRVMQKRVQFLSPVVEEQEKKKKVFQSLVEVTPKDVWYQQVNIGKENVNLNAYSASLNGFGRYISLLQKSDEFRTINVGGVTSGSQEGSQLEFNLNLQYEESK